MKCSSHFAIDKNIKPIPNSGEQERVCSDWLLKLSVFYFTPEELAQNLRLKNIVIVAGINDMKLFFFCYVISLFC